MPPVLHLGVMEVPYEEGGKTTGDVAEFLEARYHVIEHFWQAHGRAVADNLTQAMVNAVEGRLSGSPPPENPFLDAEQQAQDAFRAFIDGREMDTLGYPGIPTRAALNGVNHRMKRPYQKRSPRPSFRDTGAYEDSFRAWMDGFEEG